MFVLDGCSQTLLAGIGDSFASSCLRVGLHTNSYPRRPNTNTEGQPRPRCIARDKSTRKKRSTSYRYRKSRLFVMPEEVPQAVCSHKNQTSVSVHALYSITHVSLVNSPVPLFGIVIEICRRRIPHSQPASVRILQSKTGQHLEARANNLQSILLTIPDWTVSLLYSWRYMTNPHASVA